MPQAQTNTLWRIGTEEQEIIPQTMREGQSEINDNTGKNEIAVSNNEQFWQDVNQILADADLDKNVFDNFITDSTEKQNMTVNVEMEGVNNEGMKIKLMEGSIEDIPNDFTKRLKAIVPTVTPDGKRGFKIFVMGGEGGTQQNVSTPPQKPKVTRKPRRKNNLINLNCETMEQKNELEKKTPSRNKGCTPCQV